MNSTQTITGTGEITIQKWEFTPRERLSIIAAALMQQFNPDEPEKIQSFWDLYSYLNREKERILQMLLAGDNEERQFLWKQLDEVKSDSGMLEIYLEIHIKQDKS